MQSLASFFEDNKLLAPAAVVAAVLVLLIIVFLLYRLLFGRRLRASGNGRTRQPRLGIVDAYDLDRQRQLVLVRRDNVEHLIMIGGPTDVVVESSIVRNQAAGMPRDKDGTGSLVGTVTAPAAISGGAAPGALASSSLAVALPPAASNPTPIAARSEPSLSSRSEPGLTRPEPAQRGDGSVAGRTEPALGMPMPSPSPERAPPDRSSRPVAVPDPSAPPTPAGTDASPQPMRPAPPRPAGLPPRPAPSPSAPAAPVAAPVSGGQDRPTPSRPPLPPRPPTARPPLPPRPSLASTLPPRPPRPAPSVRTDGPARPDQARAETVGAGSPELARSPDREVIPVRGPETDAPRPEAPPAAVQPVVAPPKNIESLESLEEEMAKLLGRPMPRRDG